MVYTELVISLHYTAVVCLLWEHIVGQKQNDQEELLLQVVINCRDLYCTQVRVDSVH